jgi:hypothetical protein
MQALNMQQRCGTKYSAPCCRSAYTISSVPADLSGVKVLSAHLSLTDYLFGQVPFSSVCYASAYTQVLLTLTIARIINQFGIRKVNSQQLFQSFLSGVSVLTVSLHDGANPVGRLFCHNLHESVTAWCSIDLPAIPPP